MSFDNFSRDYVDTHDPETKCPGGKSFAECDTACALYGISEEFVPDRNITALDNITHFYHLIFYAAGCVACRQVCHVAVEMSQRMHTGRVQVVFEPVTANQSIGSAPSGSP